LKVGPKPSSNALRLSEADLIDRSSIRSASGLGSRNVKVNVSNCLVRVDTIVLPYGDARALVGGVDCAGGLPDSQHQRGRLVIWKLNDRFVVGGWKY